MWREAKVRELNLFDNNSFFAKLNVCMEMYYTIIYNGFHLDIKMFVLGHYLFREANRFPRA